jgi:diguanylate cyclase (GGDEF)-like protein
MMDVDHFKRFNDTYGHATGDVVLKRVADCMTRSMRPQDVVARYGGEEFCMLIEDVDSSTAVSLADRLRRTIASDAGQLLYEGQDVPITASLGVCWRSVPPGPLDLSEMLRLADEALYEAKRGGRNAVRLAAVAAASDAVPELTELL